jgi:hypothetical protein
MQETFEDRPWTIEAVQQLKEMAAEKVPAEVISMKLKRPQTSVHAKASELGMSLQLH